MLLVVAVVIGDPSQFERHSMCCSFKEKTFLPARFFFFFKLSDMPMEKKKETYNVQPTCKKTNIQRCEEKNLGRTLEKLRRRWLSFYTASFFLDRYNSFCAERFLPKTTTELLRFFPRRLSATFHVTQKKASRNRALIRGFLSGQPAWRTATRATTSPTSTRTSWQR